MGETLFDPYPSVRPYAFNKWRAAKQIFMNFFGVVKCEPIRMQFIVTDTLP